MQRGSYSKTAPSTHIMTFSTLAPSSSSPCPDITPKPSTTIPQLPNIVLVTGGYRFSRGRTNKNRHETHESCTMIRPLASIIFTRPAISFPTSMQPLRCHSATTDGGKPSGHGALRKFVATEVSRFVLYFCFCLNNSATILNFLLGCGTYTLFAYYWPGYQPGSSVWNGLHFVVRLPPLPHRIPTRHGLYRQLHKRGIAGEMKRRRGMSENNPGLNKSRGARRRAIVALVVMTTETTRTMMKIVRTAKVMQL